MELFYSDNCNFGTVMLDREESRHCVKVLRHVCGDRVNVIDGHGTLLECVLEDASEKGARLSVVRRVDDWGAHPYRLVMAVCPTKNADRFEWFAEKACEIGVDSIVPLVGDHSQRRVFKADRLERLLVAAAKQSLKAAVPVVEAPVDVKDFIRSASDDAIRLIACCFEDDSHPRTSIGAALRNALGEARGSCAYMDSHNLASPAADAPMGDIGELQKDILPKKEIIILIGPEGDFSPEELDVALQCGFIPVHLGSSRLRTETAALTAVEAVYLHFNF